MRNEIYFISHFSFLISHLIKRAPSAFQPKNAAPDLNRGADKHQRGADKSLPVADELLRSANKSFRTAFRHKCNAQTRKSGDFMPVERRSNAQKRR